MIKNSLLDVLYYKGTRQKKRNVENSTFGGEPDPGIFHISKKKVVFKMHFKLF